MVLWKYSEEWTTWSKRVFSKSYTFLCYTIHNMRQMHNNFCIFKFCVYLISYIRLFMKLNLFEVLLYVTFITMKVSRSTVHHHSALASNEISNYCMCINFHGVQNFVGSSCEVIRLWKYNPLSYTNHKNLNPWN